jgi:hypothetical protein
MAISRMQQPRQNYGLGSFVKKVTGKITKPITKVAKKLVPKEIAGIMRVAAPFLPTGYREAAYLLGTAKQTGRISPIDLALAAAPTIGKMQIGDTGQTIGGKLGSFNMPFAKEGTTVKDFLVGSQPLDSGQVGTKGIFGSGGEMFQFGKGAGFSDFRDKTKLGSLLLGDGEGGFSKSKIAGLGVGVLSLIQSAKTPEEAGDLLVSQTGNSDDYQRGFDLFSQLDTSSFAIPNQYRLNSAKGGLMRTNYAMGSDEPKPLPNDPTEPVNPFRPKPIGPFPSKMASVDDPFYRDSEGDRDEHSFRMFNKPYKELNEFELEEFQEEMMRLMNKFSKSKLENTKMAGIPKDLDMETAIQTFRMVFERDPKSIDELLEFFKNRSLSQGSRNNVMLAKQGGLMRENFALGTRPTNQESGLGGLPIEADMRYTGGFMPYGAVEKADDVPARLSKNEFVFTADAVRAAGGGSVQKGAKKMYDTMKQLEQQPEAKGAMA